MLIVAFGVFLVMQAGVVYFSIRAYSNLIDPSFKNWLSVAWRGAFARRASFTPLGWRYRTIALLLNLASFVVLALLVVM
jgi:hypothetical protein